MKPLNVTYYSCEVMVHLNYIFYNLCFLQIIHKEIGIIIKKKMLKNEPIWYESLKAK